MKKCCLFICCVTIVFSCFSPAAQSTQSVRLIPQANSRIVIDGQEFLSETPLPQGSLISCLGTCVIQGLDFQLLAHDKAEFSILQNDSSWTLTVKSGQLDFTLRENARLTFVGSDGTFQTEKVIPANAGGVVKGSVTVTPLGTSFAVTEGKLLLAGGLLLQESGSDAARTAATVAAIELPVAAASAALGTTAGRLQKSPK